MVRSRICRRNHKIRHRARLTADPSPPLSDRKGLSVRKRWGGRPLLVIRLDQIVRASATMIDRRSRFKSDRQRSGSRLTISTRLGSALRILLIDDAEVLIGLTDPAEPVALIEKLLRGQAD